MTTLSIVVLMPFLLAWLPWLAAGHGRRACALAAAVVMLPGLLVLLGLAPTVLGGAVHQFSMAWFPAAGLAFSLHLDGLSLLFGLLISIIGLLVVLYAHYYLPGGDDGGRFFTVLSLFTGAMLGVVLSGNLLLLVVFWELTSLFSFLLIGYWWADSGARKGARMALVVTGAGGVALLGAVVLLGNVTGSYELAAVLEQGEAIRDHGLYPLILVLVLAAVFTKSAIFPFHFWLPHAMAAPTPVSAYLHSATMVKAGVFLLARLHPALADTGLWTLLVTSAGAATLLLGACTAMFRQDLKGLLAFSTISHLGLITLLFGLGSPLASVAALFHIVNHATFKASLFMAAGIIDHETGTRDFRQLAGLRHYLPRTALLAMIAAAAMAGVPLLNGFISKEMFFAEVIGATVLGSWQLLVTAVAVVAAAFSVAYSLRFAWSVFFGEPPRWLVARAPHEPSAYMRVPVALLVIFCLLVGVFPAMMLGGLLDSAAVATLGRPTPDYHLVVWHGFDMALFLSILAMAGGLLLFRYRRLLFRWHARMPKYDARLVMEGAIGGLTRGAAWLVAVIDNRSLQRYLSLLLLSAIVVAGAALWQWPHWRGPRELMPVDPVTAMGALLMCAAALGAVFNHHERLVALIQLSAVGLMVALAFARFSAPDLALTQISVEIVTIVFLMLALYFLPQRAPNISGVMRRSRDLLVSLVVGAGSAALAWAVLTRPVDGISDFFLANSLPGGGGANVVNVILVDFRGFDTLGEITVLVIAALGIHALADRLRLDAPGAPPESRRIKPHPLIMGIVSRPMLPIALIVAVYLFLRGHNMPGGGFIAGLVTAVALILQFVARGADWAQARLRWRYHMLLGTGLLLAGLTGLVSLFLGYPFLTSAFAHVHIPLLGELELASALVFDLGVFLTVVGGALLIIRKLGAIRVMPGEPAAQSHGEVR